MPTELGSFRRHTPLCQYMLSACSGRFLSLRRKLRFPAVAIGETVDSDFASSRSSWVLATPTQLARTIFEISMHGINDVS